ncbi:cation:proton antiporter [Bacteroides caecicola]|uniref:Cation:proton antiporter n=2 Tax=Bacteroidaceae TaxID=815 RepID=A0ABS2FAQ7_9BACE|nr:MULTISPECIES: cation:proton antiporter [Bacteroidaceae]MBD8002571.1 cation:proton antiporter [Phocaeicola faecium]MBM6807176.1 cation:proton antiporter [Bacteroides caecicola]MCL1624865.1 cation:proton antiporter [Bacteroides caecicola]
MKEWFEWINFDIAFPITDPTWIFFLVLVIILFAPILLERLRIPHIIGMILAGLVVGEHGFNILARDSSFELFGKVGLYYIMFLAGLEMNMEDFKSIRMKATVLGLLAFIFPLGIGIWTNLHLLDYGLITSVLLASMYASHTLIAYPIVIRYGINRNRAVSIAVGGTAVTDTLTLLVLAVIAGMFNEKGISEMFWVWLVVKVVVLSVVIMYTFPRIGRWFFRRYTDNVVQFIFVLAMVFLGAGLMELIGMEGILGAFLAGLVLNRLIPHVSPLMSHLEFVGNALFIPYFLIGVGMLINVNVLFGHIDSIKVAGVMIVVALLGKWIASWVTQKIYGMKALERELMFGLSNAQAAATLAAVMVGYNIIQPNGERLLNEDVLNGTILLILVTCVVSSFITEHAAKRVAMSDAELNEEKGQEKERFLIPVANPETLDRLMGLAMVVRDEKQINNLVALNVINDNNDSVKQEMKGRRSLERAAQIAASANVMLKTVSRFDLNITTGILHTAKENEATSIIIGLHHKASIVDSFFGNLTENLLKGTYLQVMIVRFLIPVNTLRRIIVAVPPKAEFEHGFVKWIVHLCRMSSQLGCRLHFFAHPQTLGYIKGYIQKKHKDVLTQYQELEDWDDLLIITGQVNYDHLLVVVSSRRGSISYDSAFERLPMQISKYFNNNSIMLLYPDQKGDPSEALSFADPRGWAETQYYDRVGNWFYKWFKKDS